MQDRKYQYWFLRDEAVEYGRKVSLINYFFNSFNIYNATKSELMESGLLTEKVVDSFIENRDSFDVESEYIKFMQSPFSFVTIEDPAYPEKLTNIFDPPYGLFYIGELPDFSRCASIVGARRCSAYGRKVAYDIGKVLAEAGFVVISGMARGIDAQGHRGCLDGGMDTVAVLGSGCDVVYPEENRELYQNIIGNGAVISEYQLGAVPLPMNFPRRNRIVSALSDIVVVVEAREKSGSLITADFALEHGKDIYVVPGRMGDSLSLGCNRLISQGAGIIWNIEQFINDLSISYGTKKNIPKKKDGKTNIRLSSDLKEVYELFDLYPKSMATVMEECNLDYLDLMSKIFKLEELGLLKESFKNNYVKQG